ncbi:MULTISPECIES: gamma-glutamyl-gamma-aminobutyrate hydrolase family protein [Oceanisphaera]|uniref:Gamma-glutamyl-gamma-aminobutyrate hydrolase family protein n=1 Tax=Oceanisphaera ostreae TaxID=914151 RepID=A0ABW3KK04_9GAMM
MKPLIGVLSDFSEDDQIGVSTKLGFRGQEWQLLASDYVRAIENSGGIPVIIPVMQNQDNLPELLSRLDGLFLTGGSDIDPQLYGELPRAGLGDINPQRDAHELALVRYALAHMDYPILGICRGLQLLNVAAEGTLYQDLASQRPSDLHHTNWNAPKHHPVFTADISSGSRLAAAFDALAMPINSYNHQAVKELAPGFQATMTAPDGLIEGIEKDGNRWVCAVQWHPEMMAERHPKYLRLFSSFVEACKKS